MIYWSSLSWEAFATLVTGGGAVTAALVIGLRQMGIARDQVGIADRQSRILAKQVHLEELRLRTELFERRFAVYQATREFLADIMRSAAEPERGLQQKFLTAIDQSKFLFRTSVHDDLTDIWRRSCNFFATKSIMSHLFESTGDYGAENVENEHAYLLWLVQRLENLSDLFGEEAKLSTPLPT